MAKKIKLLLENFTVEASLYDNEMAENIWANLPLKGEVRTWGEELYFPVDVKEGEGEKKAKVEIGELGFWDQGSAFCVFYGRTPASEGEKPQAASPVVVFGKVEQGVEKLTNVSAGDEIKVERI